ncbi:MAG TPA: hypothetical protein VKP30_28130 [Polyangiaceae bacterium]|nr:hypothetical protein [Polyangiaceae bacterium]
MPIARPPHIRQQQLVWGSQRTQATSTVKVQGTRASTCLIALQRSTKVINTHHPSSPPRLYETLSCRPNEVTQGS